MLNEPFDEPPPSAIVPTSANTEPVLLNSALKVVEPVPPVLRNVPVLLNAIDAPPRLETKLPLKFVVNVPELLNTAPCPVPIDPACQSASPGLLMVRTVKLRVFALRRIPPLALMTPPVPPTVPPDQ